MKPYSVFVLIIITTFIINLHTIDYTESGWICNIPNQQSRINIPIYNENSDIIYPEYPFHYINCTFNNLINEVTLDLDEKEFITIKLLTPEGNFGQLYVTINTDYSSFSFKEIRLHAYSEHTFERNNYDEVDMKLIHILNKNGAAGTYLYLSISIFLSYQKKIMNSLVY